MPQLLKHLIPRRRQSDAYHCVLRFPDSTETRWFSQLPTPGARIYSQGGHYYSRRAWVVDEVLQSGRETYTVFCVGRNEYLEHRRRRSGYPDLGEELLDVVRHTVATVKEQRRRWKHRDYMP